jgi:hypothetical protein
VPVGCEGIDLRTNPSLNCATVARSARIKAHRFMFHSTLGRNEIKKKRGEESARRSASACGMRRHANYGDATPCRMTGVTCFLIMNMVHGRKAGEW